MKNLSKKYYRQAFKYGSVGLKNLINSPGFILYTLLSSLTLYAHILIRRCKPRSIEKKNLEKFELPSYDETMLFSLKSWSNQLQNSLSSYSNICRLLQKEDFGEKSVENMTNRAKKLAKLMISLEGNFKLLADAMAKSCDKLSKESKVNMRRSFPISMSEQNIAAMRFVSISTQEANNKRNFFKKGRLTKKISAPETSSRS